MPIRYDRLILIQDDEELEIFCRQWVDRKSGYDKVERFAGTGDLGRDVVGFLTPQRHDGAWDNFQCKQYKRKLSEGDGLLAVGKVLYWASQGRFSVPKKFYFVAPKGLSRDLATLVDQPSKFKAALVAKWGTACATKIVQGQTLTLGAALQQAIDGFDFANVEKITIDEIMADKATVPLLVEYYGADPGEYPAGVVPADVTAEELRYLAQLVDAYGERAQKKFSGPAAVLDDPAHGPSLRQHRESYFEADAFQKFYRDSTSPKIIDAFRRDIHFGIKAQLGAPSADTLARVDAVMTQASVVSPAGPLAKYAYVPVKQGICHHLVNDEVISWKSM